MVLYWEIIEIMQIVGLVALKFIQECNECGIQQFICSVSDVCNCIFY